MSESRIIVAGLNNSIDVDENQIVNDISVIKEEIIQDEDVLLFTTAEMEALSGDSNNYQIVEEFVTDSGPIDTENATFDIQGLNEVQVGSLLPPDAYSKYPIDVGQFCKLDTLKNDEAGHFVKLKLQDGKHTKVWECGICSKEFGHQYTLVRHLPTHTDERKFQCNTCGKAFRQMSTLSQHRAIHSAERPYVCELCRKTFNRVSTLISHRKTHTGHKPHRCHLCNKAFHQKGNLRNHIFTHTNARPYKCDICNKGFNQMSNLMCHKVKAHQRADKPRYVCQICGKDFQKRMGLRNHEQYQHGLQNLDPGTSTSIPTRVKYTNGVLVDPINTAAMQHALNSNQTPFALLRPLNGVPVLVRVLAAGDKQMLVPATSEDLKKHGQITIIPQVDQADKKSDPDQAEEEEKIPAEEGDVKPLGTTVQIKIPVVATVVQRCGKDGNMCMAVQSPGPNAEGQSNSFQTIYEDFSGGQENIQASSNIQYIESDLLEEGGFKAKDTFFSNNFQCSMAQSTADFSVAGPDVHENVLQEIDMAHCMNISYIGGSSADQILEIMAKPQDATVAENTIGLQVPDVLGDDPNLDNHFNIS